MEDIPDPELRALIVKARENVDQLWAELKQTPGTHNWEDDVGQAAHTLVRLMDHYETARGAKTTSDWASDFLSKFEANLEEALLSLSQLADVSGDLVVKGADGIYRWGTFEVRGRLSGELYVNHSGDSKVRFHDLGQVFIEHDVSRIQDSKVWDRKEPGSITWRGVWEGSL